MLGIEYAVGGIGRCRTVSDVEGMRRCGRESRSFLLLWCCGSLLLNLLLLLF